MTESLINNWEMARPEITGEILMATIIDQQIALQDYEDFGAMKPKNLEEAVARELERTKARACNRLELLYMCSGDTELEIESLSGENLETIIEKFSNVALNPSPIMTGQFAYPYGNIKGYIRLRNDHTIGSNFSIKILDDNHKPITKIRILNQHRNS